MTVTKFDTLCYILEIQIQINKEAKPQILLNALYLVVQKHIVLGTSTKYYQYV